MNNVFTVISYNIWFDDTLSMERTVSLLQIINDVNPDVICLQEVKSNIYEFLLTALTNHRYHFPKKFKKPYDCVIFSKYPIKKCLEYDYKNTSMGRSLQIAKVDYPYHEITPDGVSVEKLDIIITNTHFESLFKKKHTNDVKIKQFEIASEILNTLYTSYKNVILCADTNVLSHEESKFNEYFNTWLDAWLIKGSHLSKYTYDSYNNVYLKSRFTMKYLSRIDRILFKSDDLELEEFNILKGNGKIVEPSDHFGIYSKFTINKANIICNK